MRKKYVTRLLLTIALAVVVFLSWLGVGISRKIEADKTLAQKRTVLPQVRLFTMDSLAYTISTENDSAKIIVIHFNSECEHCRYEAEDIKNNISFFEKHTLIMMSSEPLSKIKAFAEHSGLTQFPCVVFTKINSEDAVATFGTLSVPHIFIYGSDRTLRKEFKGETKVSAIANYL